MRAFLNKIPFLSTLLKYWHKYREDIEEWYHVRFHTIVVAILIVFNILFLVPASIFTFLKLTMDIEPIIPIIPLYSIKWSTFIVLFNIPIITWMYSTICQPIKKGYKIIIDYKTTKAGRLAAGFLNLVPGVLMFWALGARYVSEEYKPYFTNVEVDPEVYSYLMVTSMDTFIYFLYSIPIFFTIFCSIIITRQFMKFKELRESYFKWEPSFLSSQSFNLRDDSCDVVVGWDKKTKKPLVLKENSRYLHEIVVGATGSGKTSTTILIRVVQDLIRIAKGKKMSVVCLEPKGDLVVDVLKLAKKLGIPDEKIHVVDPTGAVKSVKFNPFFGPLEEAAENFRGVLDALTGDQDQFFKGQQNETAALYTMLAKLRFNNMANVTHLQQMYTDARYLANMTEEVRKNLDESLKNPDLTEKQRKELARYERIVSYFEDEVLEYKTYRDKDGSTQPVLYTSGKYEGQWVVESKKDKYVTGAKKYLNDISMNAMLTDLMLASSDDTVLDIDKIIDEGGIILVNSALGELQELSLMLGQFFIRQFQSAVFRRPREEVSEKHPDGYKRAPCFLTVDEFPLYINDSFERLLTLGRSYKVGTLIAIQSLGQLEAVKAGYDKTILANASSKTVFGRGTYEDNELFSNEFGEEVMVEESLNETATPVTVENQSWSYRFNSQRKLTARFSPTDIAELPFKHMIVRLVEEDGSIGKPTVAVGKFVNETNFIKKYIDFKNVELNTKKKKDLDVSGATQKLKDGIPLPFSESIPNTESKNISPSQPPVKNQIEPEESKEESKTNEDNEPSTESNESTTKPVSIGDMFNYDFGEDDEETENNETTEGMTEIVIDEGATIEGEIIEDSILDKDTEVKVNEAENANETAGTPFKDITDSTEVDIEEGDTEKITEIQSVYELEEEVVEIKEDSDTQTTMEPNKKETVEIDEERVEASENNEEPFIPTYSELDENQNKQMDSFLENIRRTATVENSDDSQQQKAAKNKVNNEGLEQENDDDDLF